MQDDGEFVEGVCREVDAYEVALLVQTLQQAPFHIFLRDGRCGNLYAAEVTEQGILCGSLGLLVGSAKAHEGVEEDLALDVLC